MITPAERNEARRLLLVAGYTNDDVAELLDHRPGLRDEFAGRVMAAMIEPVMRTKHADPQAVIDKVAGGAYKIADAMMRARSEP